MHKMQSRAGAIVLLTVLAIAAIVLTALAFSAQRQQPAETPSATPKTLESPTPKSSESKPKQPEEPKPKTEKPQSAAVPTRLLTTGPDPEHLLRATAGECGTTPGTLEVSFDGGANWDASQISDFPNAALRQIDASDTAVSRLVLLNEVCEPQFAQSFVGGTDWESATEPGPLWYLLSAPSATGYVSAASVELPCDAVAIAGSASRGIALCEDSHVSTSEDSGVTWSKPVAAPMAAAVAVSAEGFVVASANEPECAGVRTREFSGGNLAAPGACLQVEVAGKDVAIAEDAQTLFLWAGNTFARSSDLGSSWN
ncbi:MAG: hypothetical protein ACK5LO_10555 [Leucobacter sp.]